MATLSGGNYGSVGQQINKQNQTLNQINMESSPDYGKIAEEAIKGRSKERRAAIEAEAQVHKKGLDAMGTKKLYQIKADTDKEIAEIKKPAKRFAGIVGAAGTIAGGFVLKKFSDEAKQRDEDREAKWEAHRARIEEAYSRERPELMQLPDPVQYETPTLIDPGSSTGGGATSGNGGGGGGGSVSTYQSQPLASSVDVSKLTDDDFKHLAYAISSEAGPGKDRYGVAASILNRVSSKDWPGSVKDVIFQDGQYEGVYQGKSSWRPDIAADLSSPQGRAEIVKALNVLDGRTDFKGQTMLQYRSNKGNKGGMMDPMFDPKGNFFHYSWQT